MMVSSKVNQWTPSTARYLAFGISSGGEWTMHSDMRQREEIFLTSAQSLFGLVIIANFRFTVFEALALFVLFARPTSATARWFYAVVYTLLAPGWWWETSRPAAPRATSCRVSRARDARRIAAAGGDGVPLRPIGRRPQTAAAAPPHARLRRASLRSTDASAKHPSPPAAPT